MTDQHSGTFLEKVEEIRLLAKENRQQSKSANDATRVNNHESLTSILTALDDNQMVDIARAFNQFLNLSNIAEQAESTEAFHEYQLDDLFKRLLEQGTDKETIYNAVTQMRCELVLTAHPTEITRRTLIQKYNRIADALEDVREDTDLSRDARLELERLIAEVWYTDEIRTERPTPQDEAKWGYAVIEHSLWEAIPRLWNKLDEITVQYTDQHLTLQTTPIRISSWMGGDRDGNPNVTSQVTNEVLRLARWMAADLYLRDVEELLSQLSMSVCTEELQALCGATIDEPYRYVLRDLREKLTVTRSWAETDAPYHEGLIRSDEDLIAPLQACFESLHTCGMGIIADGLLKDTLIRANTFGVTLVELDIRQASDKHIELLDAVTRYLELGSYREWSEKARTDFLLQELETKRPLVPDSWEPDGEAGEILKTFRLISENNGDGISSYIISMAKRPSDVLAVVLLLKKSGLDRVLPVVPLFETLDDLDNAAWTLERLLRTSWYTKHIQGSQQVMIGYSDSAKDAGQMAAAWAQYRAQEELVVVAEKYDIDLTLFHGRGGAPGRGGGPARQAILSQPPGSVKTSMRVTEQGEMIRFKYGSPSLALINLDLVLSSVIEASLLPPPKPRENWRLLIQRLSEVAHTSYREVVKGNPDFIDYFVEGTPERELALLALGSRPARRSGNDADRSITELRAIPWVFAWTQKRLMLPAWLGTDAAFEEELTGKEWHVLREMIEEWPFFQTQINMLEMVLSKADAGLSAEYDETLVPAELHGIGDNFRQRLNSLIDSVCKLKNQETLLQNNPEIKQTLDLRHPYTDPLHLLQVELIKRVRQDASDDLTQAHKALLVTIAGIAASMRNTG